MIGWILAGVLSGGDLDRVLRDNYRRPQPRVDPEFGGGRAGSWPGPAWPGPSWPGPAGDGPSGEGPWGETPAPAAAVPMMRGWRTGGRF